jgi:hypothetical protein
MGSVAQKGAAYNQKGEASPEGAAKLLGCSEALRAQRSSEGCSLAQRVHRIA